MIRLPTAALAALRARLAAVAARPSLTPSASTPGAEIDAAIVEELAPLSDAMVLMMAADGDLGAAERDVVRGALRELDDRVRSRHVEALVQSSRDALLRLGSEGLREDIARALGGDPARAEVALVLAAAVAYADGEIAEAEDATMNSLMSSLGVSPARVRALLGALERVDSALLRDAKADPADLLVHAALHLRTPEDFERLAARAAREDVSTPLRLYGAYVHALDAILDTQSAPASVPAAAVEALVRLVDGLPQHRTPRLDRARASLGQLATALGGLAVARSTRELVAGEFDALDAALAELSSFTAKALARVGAGERRAYAEGAFADVGRLLADTGEARSTASLRASEALQRLGETLPPALATAVSLVLGRVVALPRAADGAPDAPPEARMPEWVPASRVLGGFRLLSPLGSGGSGSVFVAVRASDDGDPEERFALKVPQYDAVAARAVSESEYLAVFKREAGALLAVPEHPNLAAFVTFDARSRPKPLLVMELVDGVDCQTLLGRRALDLPAALRVLDDVLAGLCAMHDAGVGHLDVKPSNVVVRPSGAAALVDFGLAGRHLRIGCATPAYASPEVWGVVDGGTPATADAYSFACLAFELLCGAPLFRSTSAVALFAEHAAHDGGPEAVKALEADVATRALGGWVGGLLRRDPAARTPLVDARASLSEVARSLSGRAWPLGTAR